MESDDAWRLTGGVTHEFGKGDPFAAAVRATRMAMIITDPRQDDNPIVFANNAFLRLTGYDRDEIMGRNCRFLQGAETDQLTLSKISDAIKSRSDISIDVLNFRKDGTSFWNALYISPVFTQNGELQYFFASQLDVTDRRDALAAKTALLHEVDHRVKNNLMMVSALIRMQSRSIADPNLRESLENLIQRIEALSKVHRRLYQSEDITKFSITDSTHALVTELLTVMGRDDVVLKLELDQVFVSAAQATSLTLIVNELVTNVFKHALPDGRAGCLRVSVKRFKERARITVEDDGIGMVKPSGSTSFGQNLIRVLCKQLRADINWESALPSGTRAILQFQATETTSMQEKS